MKSKSIDTQIADDQLENELSGPKLIAYRVSDNALTLRPAERRREWMDEAHFPYRCLPLAMANQLGWELLCPVSFSVIWNGTADKSGVAIEFHDEKTWLIDSHFGLGTLTFSPGYLFRTPMGHDLWASGPANTPKDGIYALEGLIETDWAPFTFTMNWKLTRPKHIVTFEKGEPICRIVPYPKPYIEQFQPEIRDLNKNPGLAEEYKAWGMSRQQFNQELQVPGSEATKQQWMRHYMRGVDKSGASYGEQHRVKLELRPFTDLTGTGEAKSKAIGTVTPDPSPDESPAE